MLYGTPQDLPKHLAERIELIPESTCWWWIGYLRPDGYGTYNPKRPLRAHRLVYKELVGDIPEGKMLDHLCRNHSCVNPRHLEPVTPEENTRRGINVGSVVAHMSRSKMHCPAGHPYDETNTRIVFRTSSHDKPKRQCIACRKALRKRMWQKEKSTCRSMV